MKYRFFFQKSKTVHIICEKNLKRLKKIYSIRTQYKGRYKNNCIDKKT